MTYRRKTWLSRLSDALYRRRLSRRKLARRIPAGDADGYVDWP